MKYVVDTSVLIERLVTDYVKKKKLKGEIVVPRAVVAELENQANTGRETGFLGLEELQNLQKEKVKLTFYGERPNLNQIKGAKRGGEIDSMIIDVAFAEKATLVTADMVQAESAKALGLKVMYIEQKIKQILEIEKFFDEKTMSVHLREGVSPLGKKGQPGAWELVQLQKKKLTQEDIQKWAKEIVERARKRNGAFVEISRRGSTIVQYGQFRIVIVRPPVADGWEITAVKPLVQLDLDQYDLPATVFDRLKESASGVLVAGEVGSGKSTFCQSLAEYYAANGRVVKTVESPRDLILSEGITQYSKNFASGEEIHDILFLSRPDNIIFDEMRDTPDFKLFVDLRLGGSSMMGVLHSASPIDAVQRFISRIEVGMIPSVLDTIIFVDKGEIAKVLTLGMKVKVPSGMTEADLARPVIEVKDLQTSTLVFEIYSYGEVTVVIPIGDQQKTGVEGLAEKHLRRELKKYCSNFEVEVVGGHKVRVYVPPGSKGKLIGPKGVTIDRIEKSLGISIDVVEKRVERVRKRKLSYQLKERGNTLLFTIDKKGREVDFFNGDDYLLTSTSGKKGEIKLNKRSEIGKRIVDLLDDGEKIVIRG